MNKKVIFVLLISLLFILVGCGDNSNNSVRTVDYQVNGEISTIYYEKLNEVSVKYQDKLIGKSDENGNINLTVTLEETEQFSLNRLSFELDGYVFAIVSKETNNNHYRLIIKANTSDAPASWADEFFSVGGKVVYHYDGETRVVGAKVYVNGHLVKVIGEDGNFDLSFVVKNSEITVEYDGYKFVDITGTPLKVIITEDSFGVTFRAVPNEE